MITRDDPSLYAKLFNDISISLGFSGDDAIADIGDYFYELDSIRSAVESGKADPYWLIIPGDEELFEIDANTRNIKIPTDFAKNGIGVQGDHLAEVLYFAIDRYFDTADLYEKEIFIQFELPNGDRYLTAAINKTLKFINNKVVFGWLITDVMTENAGNIKFSIRFYDRNEEKELSYSFGTLTATVKVNSSLDFDISSEDEISSLIIDAKSDYYANLRGSTADNIDFKAALPEFVDMSPDFATECDLETRLEGRAVFTETSLEINGKGEATRKMGDITYGFRYTTDKGIMNDNYEVIYDYYEINTATEAPNKYEAYYTKETIAEREHYVPYAYTTWENTAVGERPSVLYKVKAWTKPNKAGFYQLTANNKAGRGNSITAVSDTWVVPYAKEADINEGTYLHQKIEQGGSIELKPTISSPDNGELSYQWQWRKTDKEEYSDIEGATEATYKVDNQEGRFIVKVENNKNNSNAKTTSEEMRVSYPPAEPVDIEYQIVGSGDKDYITKAESIGVSVNIGSYSDELGYQWYKLDDNGESQELSGEKKSVLTHLGTGRYYVKITNIYNSFESVATSEKFTIGSIKE